MHVFMDEDEGKSLFKSQGLISLGSKKPHHSNRLHIFIFLVYIQTAISSKKILN